MLKKNGADSKAKIRLKCGGDWKSICMVMGHAGKQLLSK